jgi:hypothetical protein
MGIAHGLQMQKPDSETPEPKKKGDRQAALQTAEMNFTLAQDALRPSLFPGVPAQVSGHVERRHHRNVEAE